VALPVLTCLLLVTENTLHLMEMA